MRAEKLAQWRAQLWQHCGEHCSRWTDDEVRGPLDTGTRTAPPTIWPALQDCISRYHIPLDWLDNIITGVVMDLEPRQPNDWFELRNYCYHVASSVGLACALIWRSNEREITLPTGGGLADASQLRAAIECGIAFQLTNILRDIAEDSRRGRIYVPQSLFAAYRVDSAGWLDGRPSGNWEEMLDEVAHQARSSYSAGWQTICPLTPQSQRMFSLMWRTYRDLLERIVANKQLLWGSPRIRLPKRQRIRLLTTHFVSPIYARLSPP